MSKMKIAIIGCGSIANNAHIPAYMKNEEVEIKYFCDIIKSKADAAVEKFGCGIAVEDYHEILSDPEIEAVSVCTPNKMHSTITIDFLRAGKNVLCEKPSARTLAEAKEMQAAQHETGKVLNIGVVNRFNSAVNRLRDLIQAGELGEIYHVYVSFRSHRSIPGLGGAFTNKSIAGGGVLIDWGVHYIDLALYCIGDPTPLTCSGEAYCKLGKDMKDYVCTSMWASDTADFEKGTYDVDDFVSGFVRTTGANITINGAWAQNIGEAETFVDFLGTKAGVRLYYGGKFTMYSTLNGMLTEIKTDFATTGFDYGAEVKAFVEAVETRTPNQAYIDRAVITSRILDGLYRSSDAKKEVTL